MRNQHFDAPMKENTAEMCFLVAVHLLASVTQMRTIVAAVYRGWDTFKGEEVYANLETTISYLPFLRTSFKKYGGPPRLSICRARFPLSLIHI